MEDFPITICAKAKNGLLWKAVKQCGSQSALAKRLGVHPSDIGDLINMKRTRNFTTPKWRAAELRLMELCGLDWDRACPKATRTDDFLALPKEIEFEQRVPLSAIENGTYQTLLPSAEEEATNNLTAEELSVALSGVLKTLSYREREIIKLRYGLGDGYSYTLEEVGHIFKVTREVIRQIEAKALRKLQCPGRGEKLIGFVN